MSAIKALMMLLINLISVADVATAIAKEAVEDMHDQAAINRTIAKSQFAVLAVSKASVDQAVAQEVVQKFIKDNEARKAAVDEANIRLTKAVNAEMNRLAALRNGATS
jgi:hypothetical protein